MKKLKKMTSALALMLCSLTLAGNLYANPAFPKPVTIKQSNGKYLTYTIYGDEHLSWAKTSDGYTLMSDGRGDMVYAVIDNEGNMVPSEIIAANPNERSAKEQQFVATLSKDVFYSQNQVVNLNQRRVQRDALNKQKPLKKFTTDKPRLLVVLVNYTDVKFDSANAVQFKHQIQDSAYTQNGYTGSVRDYFADNSFQEIDPQFDVYGPITLPNSRSHYAQNGNNNAWQMARDAAYMIDTMYDVDFSVYDNDGDNVIDLIHIIYAGVGSNSTGQRDQQVWPHMYYITNNMRIDGKRFYRYACSSELTAQQSGWSYNYVTDGIGAVCHEMGHAFGLPDMYDTGNSDGQQTAVHPASWDVMASGSYNNNSKTPPYYSMIERDMIGWGNVVNLTDGEKKLYPIGDSNTAYKFHLNNDEYLMFEYRNHDKWDAYTQGIGMLVWHADTSLFANWESHNGVNDDPDHRGYYIECAGNESALESASTPYPGSLHKTSIDYFTLIDGTEIDGNVSDIHYDGTADSTILFTFRQFLPVIFKSEVKDISQNSAVISIVFESEETISDRTLQYKKSTENNYTIIDLDSDSVEYLLDNLEINTVYDYRFSAKTDTISYFSIKRSFRTLCEDGVISSFPWVEGFESGVACWSQDGTNGKWEVKDALYYNNQLIAQPTQGNNFAYFSLSSQSYSAQRSRLVSPVIDITGLDNAELSFDCMPLSYADPALTVAYRLSESESWKTLGTYTTQRQGYNIINQWQNVSVSLPEKSSSLQISFMGSDNYGLGVVLDNVSIKGDASGSSIADVQDNNSAIILSVTPNPANSDASLQLKGFEGQTTITVSDVMGRVIEEISLNADEREVKLNSSSYTNGIYYIKAANKERSCVEKFIKQ